ncbi:hypothetical protein [Pseudomonas lini]|uniref:hypothetical protein n=1 Tax=Pseudomonas lini TaxID=163011 RepID=UPI00345ED6C3
MLDYLLAEKNFATLKQYVNFLNELPDALREINRFSDSIARAGHTLLRPPDAQTLIQAGLTNAQCWRAIGITVPVLGNTSARVLQEVSGFISEFKTVVSVTQNRRLPISRIDPQQFTVVKSVGWGNAPCADVIDVMRELDARLEHCQQSVAKFKAQVTTLAESIHGLFVRFIESLSLPLCSCDGPIPKIEAYYTLGRIGLPGMGYNPNQGYSEDQRLEMAKAHIGRLFNLYRQASTAANNLGDFCYRWAYMVEEAKRTLRTSHPHQTMARAKASLPLLTGSLEEVKTMSEQLVQMAKVL